jgi:RimJ/RimL family protein N-acetyltransferase
VRASVLPIVTARLELRDFTPDDWQAVHGYASDPRVTRYLAWGPNSAEDTTGFLAMAGRNAACVPRTSLELAIVEREGGGLVGGCGLWPRGAPSFAGPPQEVEIGYCLRPDRWGRGVASEAVRALVAFGFHTMTARRIYGVVDPDNHASARLLESAGFRCEGRRRRAAWSRGAWCDALVYALGADERVE